MPLIDLKTDLKSLKFGKDRPGGGSSNQPYIQKDIPEGDPSNLFNTGGPDFLLRGGLLAPVRAANDVSRLTQMFFDLKSPNGLLFTATENLLSRTAVKTEASKGAGYGGGTVNAGIYTPLSTLGQAAAGFSGTHLNLLGIDPTSPMAGVVDGGLFPGAGLNRYGDVVKNKDKEDNRLVGLYTSISNNTSVSNFGFQKGVNLNVGNNILQYPGGPGSVLGIGNTNIPFADQRTGTENPLATTNPVYFLTGSRWNDRTTDSWISPLTKGASGKYEDYIGDVGSLIFEDGNPIITPDGGYSYEQNWDYTTTKSGSLEAREDVVSGSYLNGGLKLSSVDYTNSVNGITNQILGSGITLENDGIPYYAKTTSGSFYNKAENIQLTEVYSLPVSVVSPENEMEGGVRVNYSSSANSITKQILDSGITLENDGVPYYAKTTSGSFYNKAENTQLTEVASLPVSVQTLDGTQEGGIRINYSNAISADGVSNLYNTLVEPISGSQLDNEYTDKNFFNVYDPNTTPGNTWPLNTILQVTNGSLTFNQREIIETTPISKGGIQQDFRKTLLDNTGATTSTIMSLAPSYNPAENKTIEGRVNIGNPGTKKDVYRYSTSTAILDKINASGIYSAESPNHSGDKNDLVKFSIGIQKPSSTESRFMNFRAFIDSFSDQYSADWGNVQYVGRGDKFYNYKGFDRTISMGWTVYAQSKAELIPMYKKLNYLASSLAPFYSSAGYMQGNLARLTVGGYLYNQLGIIKGLTYDIPTESPWEIAINESGGYDSTVKELPFMIKVTGFTFTPIQDFIPQKALFNKSDGKQTSRFISLSKGGNNNNY